MKNLSLEKEDNMYCLKQLNTRLGDIIIACSDDETSELLNFPFKISKENCDNIFGLFNLENLSKEYSSKVFGNNENSKIDFMAGFNKAIEIFGGKEYNLLQVYSAFEAGERNDRHLLDDVITDKNKKITVEIELDDIIKSELSSIKAKPKLDENGYIILKKK